MKNFLKATFAAGIFTVVAAATPVTSLTAGLYTLSNITCSGVGCTDITASATTISLSETGGLSSITFSDSGASVATSGVQIDYDVTYSGVDPIHNYHTLGYWADETLTPYFLGNESASVGPVCLNCDPAFDDYPGLVSHGNDYFLPGNFNDQYTNFDYVEFSQFLYLGPPSVLASPGEFTTTFAAVDAPEPLSFTLFGLGLLLVAIQQVRRTRRFRRDGR